MAARAAEALRVVDQDLSQIGGGVLLALDQLHDVIDDITEAQAAVEQIIGE